MILTDVEETYSVRVMREVEKERTLPSEIDGGATTTETKTRILPKLDVRTRRIQQVFVRGEQIVSVSIPPSGA
jgi:small nuclear ribonucleoprotein (snRNP)-like protein